MCFEINNFVAFQKRRKKRGEIRVKNFFIFFFVVCAHIRVKAFLWLHSIVLKRARTDSAKDTARTSYISPLKTNDIVYR